MEKENLEKNSPKTYLIVCPANKLDSDTVREFIQKLRDDGNEVIIQETDKSENDIDGIVKNLPAEVEFKDIILSQDIPKYSSQKTYEESFPKKSVPILKPREHQRIFRKQKK